jgi:hypothetical protein
MHVSVCVCLFVQEYVGVCVCVCVCVRARVCARMQLGAIDCVAKLHRMASGSNWMVAGCRSCARATLPQTQFYRGSYVTCVVLPPR